MASVFLVLKYYYLCATKPFLLIHKDLKYVLCLG